MPTYFIQGDRFVDDQDGNTLLNGIEVGAILTDESSINWIFQGSTTSVGNFSLLNAEVDLIE